METQGGNEFQLDDDSLLSGHSDHLLSNGDGDGEQEMSSIEEYSDGDEEDGRDAPMDIESSGPQVSSTVKETAMPSTSTEPMMAVTSTATAPGPTETSSLGAPTDNPGVHGYAAALAAAIEIWVLASPALAVVMAQMGQGVACNGSEGDKALEEDNTGVMQGLHAIARIMSTGFEKASEAVQSVMSRTLEGVIQ